MHCLRQTTKAVVSALLCLELSISSTSCLALEKQAAPKKWPVVVRQTKINGFNSRLQNTVWWQIANRHQLDPYVLYAVALVESAKRNDPNHITPWPWAINKSGKAIIPASQQEARSILTKALAEGSRNIDVGLMQINFRWHGHRVDKPEHLLNPVTNLQIGALLLSEAIQSAPNNLVLGIGHYHSWQNVSAAVAYGRKVLAVADQIRAVL
ncbi:lytic transglycosylase domain-containing protein [Methylovulum miyakonense]|uniref:lytic transglycosylase domain-containing protein n=1 Tax=Methylovulum miyakonense TaxID=645578 RepID=UPI000379C11A|nr:lytic transglycosylase domain-containing protein [Methylovulum miyakonense]